jgi:hypothetical protein
MGYFVYGFSPLILAEIVLLKLKFMKTLMLKLKNESLYLLLLILIILKFK